MRPHRRLRSFLLAGLLTLTLPPNPSRAVSIPLVPDGSTTIEIGETVNIDVFLVLDASDQEAGISAATLHLELGSDFVDVVSSTSGSVFSTAATNVVHGQDFIVFSEFGGTVASSTTLWSRYGVRASSPQAIVIRSTLTSMSFGR